MRLFSLFPLVGVILCLGSALPSAALASNYKAIMATAEADFELGLFESALSELQGALNATDNHAALANIHLLRARCYSGLGDQEAMRDAFTSALEHDPFAELDPNEVSPRIVEVLEELKATLKAEISIRTNMPGALVLLDGKNIGVAPLRTKVPIGHREFELRDPAGVHFSKRKALIRARQSHDLYIPLDDGQDDRDDFMTLAESSDVDGEHVDMDTDTMRLAAGEHAGRNIRFLIDLRYTLGGAFGDSPKALKGTPLALDEDLRTTGFELGIGVTGRDLFAMVAGTFDGSAWGTTVKFGFRRDHVFSIVGFQGSFDLPMVFPDGNFYLGAGASFGVNLTPVRFMSIFLEGSYRYFFLTPDAEKLKEKESQFFGNNLWGASLGLRFFI
ncbi:MAG: PEGA domain-containing protein [Myxococcales bacterium]|jgi:tetratricopeptide (TPR) repeat protein|nr:PEGA domain-containing protein [Myxococcales bacterium]